MKKYLLFHTVFSQSLKIIESEAAKQAYFAEQLVASGNRSRAREGQTPFRGQI